MTARHKVLERLSALGELELNWDSYGGLPIHRTAIEAASRLIRSSDRDSLMPAVVPLSDGGISLEWRVAGGEFDLVIGPDGNIRFFVSEALP